MTEYLKSGNRIEIANSIGLDSMRLVQCAAAVQPLPSSRIAITVIVTVLHCCESPATTCNIIYIPRALPVADDDVLPQDTTVVALWCCVHRLASCTPTREEYAERVPRSLPAQGRDFVGTRRTGTTSR